MRVLLNLSDPLTICGSDVNLVPAWPTWFPGRDLLDRSFSTHAAVYWISRNWHLSVYLTALYLIAIVVGQWMMSARRPLHLNRLLIAWNVAFAIFSAIGAYLYLPVMLAGWWTGGYTAMVCDLPVYQRERLTQWAVLFTWSKVAEFGDTAFLILRKRRVIALHWVHHAATCVMCFFGVHNTPAFTVQCLALNYAVHALMYAYYAGRAAGFRIGPSWASWITRLQIGQMFADIWAICWSYWVMEHTARPCYNDPALIYPALVTLCVFAALFVNYFIRSYLLPLRAKTIRQKMITIDFNNNSHSTSCKAD